ncbi:DUF2029 domain-containing protein [Candidatus Curtissbacteria bacterium]|nr:DUF2029 domain-containing protein [Candidatus Curtissbacteria bacterium]
MPDLKKNLPKKTVESVLSLDAILFTILAFQYLITSTAKVTSYIFISTIIACIIFYLLIDHYSKIKLTRFAFKLKNITFFLIVLLLIYIPAIKLISIRMDNTSPILIVDGAIMVEEASKKLLEFKNPYSISYQDALANWPYKVGDIKRNPTVDHFPYLPAIVIINSAGYLIFQNILGFFDTRIISLIFLTCSLYLIFRFTKLPQKKIVFATLVAFNPLFISSFLWGLNDIYIVFFILATTYALKAKKYQLAIALFAIASAIKQLAWPLAPFLFFYLANLDKKAPVDKIKFLLQSSKYAGVLFAVVVLPFVIQNPKNFWDDIWIFSSDTTVLSGYGFSEILYNMGIIQSRSAYFPFGLLQILIAVPATLILLWRQKKNNKIGQVLLNYSLLLFLLLYFARNLNHNYIAYLSTLVTITFFVSSEEFIPRNKVRNQRTLLR